MTKTKPDRRLLGTWRSDRRRTLRELRFPRHVSRKKQEPLRAIFGKLKLTYTRSRVRYALDDWRATRPHEVLASDSNSVAIRLRDETTDEWIIQHLHFDPKNAGRYWVSIGFGREWFKKLSRA
jgi:hypothetical protein